ncbi:hypothetical protein P7C70_g5136, partial [Phenoliferia sp. Uapishka_3]
MPSDDLAHLPPELVRLVIEADSHGLLLDSSARRRRQHLLQLSTINSVWRECAMEEVWRNMFLEQWSQALGARLANEFGRGEYKPRVETLTLGSVAPLENSSEGWEGKGNRVDEVARLVGGETVEVCIIGCDDLSIDKLSCFKKLRTLHLNLSGHYKFVPLHAAEITSTFTQLSRLTLIDVPLIDCAAIFAAGSSFPLLSSLVLIRPQFAHPIHPLEPARKGSHLGPQLKRLILGEHYQHALTAGSIRQFVNLETLGFIGSQGTKTGAFRCLHNVRAPLRELRLAHAMEEEVLLATLRERPVSVSRLAVLNLLELDDDALPEQIETRREIGVWASKHGCEIRERVETTSASWDDLGNDLAELELELLTQPIGVLDPLLKNVQSS